MYYSALRAAVSSFVMTVSVDIFFVAEAGFEPRDLCVMSASS
jgi:hypothetical protein